MRSRSDAVPRPGRAEPVGAGVQRDLHAEFPCAGRQSVQLLGCSGPRGGGTAGRGGRCDRLRWLSMGDGRDRREPARIQDPYGLRVYPVAHASVVASLDSLGRQLERTLNTAQENPLFDVDGDSVIHHGAFYQASLSLELDGATLALALTSPITHSRIRMLNDPDTNGGNAFLAAEHGRLVGTDDGRVRRCGRDRRDPRLRRSPRRSARSYCPAVRRRTPLSPLKAPCSSNGRSPRTGYCSHASSSGRYGWSANAGCANGSPECSARHSRWPPGCRGMTMTETCAVTW